MRRPDGSMTKSRRHVPSRLTRNQRLVLDAIDRAKRPVGAYEILRRLQPQGLHSPVQIYRAVDRLILLGNVHRVEKLNAFVACSCPHGDTGRTAILAICEDCGRVTEFHDEAIESRLDAWAKTSGFHIERVCLELTGRCGSCAPAPPKFADA